MKPSMQFCGEQILRMEGLPYFNTIGQNGYRSLAEALMDEARTEDEAAWAVSALMADPARASNPATNRAPSPGELRTWVQAQRPDKYDTPPPITAKKGCGKVIEKWTDPDGGIARCENGWIRRRVWQEIRGMVDENGGPLRQPYDFSGRCNCQDGGWL